MRRVAGGRTLALRGVPSCGTGFVVTGWTRSVRARRAPPTSTFAPLVLGARLGRAHPGSYPGFGSQPSEQPESGLLHDLELGVLRVDAQLVQRRFLGFFDRAPCRLDPFHDALPALAATAVAHVTSASPARSALGCSAVTRGCTAGCRTGVGGNPCIGAHCVRPVAVGRGLPGPISPRNGRCLGARAIGPVLGLRDRGGR
jgi:hypothetical protein